MRKPLLFASALVLAVIVINSCTFEKYEVPTSASSAATCDSTVHYYPTITNILTTQCSQGTQHCHASGTTAAGAINWGTTWSLVAQNANNGSNSILTRVCNLQGIAMPLAGPISDTLRSQLRCWILQGALNN